MFNLLGSTADQAKFSVWLNEPLGLYDLTRSKLPLSQMFKMEGPTGLSWSGIWNSYLEAGDKTTLEIRPETWIFQPTVRVA